jgi:signal transduction histidine kinase
MEDARIDACEKEKALPSPKMTQGIPGSEKANSPDGPWPPESWRLHYNSAGLRKRSVVKGGIMDTLENPPQTAPRSLPEAVTRTLRHEVGDLLQTVYATVAILQRRLPSDSTMERRILADMRTRAEACKQLLDVVHDFVCPIAVTVEPVKLADVVARAKETAQSRYRELQFQIEASADPEILADPRRLAQVGDLLLANACEAAHAHVSLGISLSSATDMAEWTITDDGPGVPEDHLERLFTPFFTTRHGHPGLGLALAHKLVTLQGGNISADNVQGGGFRVRVRLPAADRESQQGTQSFIKKDT